MKFLSAYFILSFMVAAYSALTCDRLLCPEEAITCNINYVVQYASKTKTNNATCIDIHGKILLSDVYNIILDDYPEDFPVLECSGYKCPKGTVQCFTNKEYIIGNNGAAYLIRILCKDFKDNVLDERLLQNTVNPLPFEIVPPPPVCYDFTCPVGAHSCTYDKTTYPDPYRVVVIVKCLNLKKEVLHEEVIKSK